MLKKRRLSVSLLDFKCDYDRNGDITLVKSDLSGIIILPVFLLTGKEHALETLGRYYRHIRYYDILWKVTNSSNFILINLAISQKRYNMAFL